MIPNLWNFLMKNKIWLALLIFGICSCSHPKKTSTGMNSEEIEQFQSKIAAAKKSVGKAAKRVQKLRLAVLQEEVKCIQLKIRQIEESLVKVSQDSVQYRTFLEKELPVLFSQERSVLMGMIAIPEVEKEAHETLDHILRLITKLNDEKQSRF
jgi:septal ring factor EnvC (AmiA/AmiB activator)